MAAPQESSRRRAGIRFGVAVQILLAAVLLGAANYAGFNYYWRGDWSPAQKYRLSEQTSNLLAQLPSPVTIYVFFSPTAVAPGFEVYGDVVNLLREYQAAAGDRLTVEYIDPMRNLARARELQARFDFGAEENLVIVAADDRHKLINAADMAEYDGLSQLTGDPPRVLAFKGEQALTSAMLELGEGKQRAVYFLQGQGEPAVGENSRLSLFEEHIERQGFKTAPLNLGVRASVPPDAALVIVAGPRYDVSAPAEAALREYWEKEGRFLVLLDPDSDTPLLREFIASTGVKPRADRVLRTIQLGFATGIMRDVAGQFSADNRVTRRLLGAEAMLPGATSSLEIEEDAADTLLEPMITAAEPFWGEIDHVTDSEKGVAFDEGKDTPAPLVLAAMVERGGVADEKVEVSSARMVVVGNSGLLSDGSVTAANMDFAIGSINWLADRAHLSGIAPKATRAFNLNLTDLETGRIALYTVVVIPAVALLAGLVVWWRRRR